MKAPVADARGLREMGDALHRLAERAAQPYRSGDSGFRILGDGEAIVLGIRAALHGRG